MADSEPETWSPPDFGSALRTQIGASIVEQFVAGHDASDVLRELVQNEFDGGGDRLTVTFGADALVVTGNGRNIDSNGWKRLSVIIGTGRVVGEGAEGSVAPKTNGIGSKNFGLRSLFLFGDQIYVRSGGHVALLNLTKLETGRLRDAGWWGGRGVRLQVPYRSHAFEKLEPFTVDAEKRAFDAMATSMFATLFKLVVGGRKPGLRMLTLRSDRHGRTLNWQQKAERVTCQMRGVSALSRKGRLTDVGDDGSQSTLRFEELEFTRSVRLPAEYAKMSYPAYYRRAGGMIAIGVSLPNPRRRLDLAKPGSFYYPLQAPASHTGCAVSVSAPFDLDSDRSSLLDNTWNRWLMEQAAAFTMDLVKEDWFRRFGADAFRALKRNGLVKPTLFADIIEKHLSEEACWPTKSRNAAERYARASLVVVVDDPALDDFLSDNRYLDPVLHGDQDVRELAIKSGAGRFTVSSLVRLKCASKDRTKLETKIADGEADFHYTDYGAALSALDRQTKFAEALTKLSKRLSKANRADIGSSLSTLTASGELRPAKDLILVDSAIWDVCPEPAASRLHPALVAHGAIADHCSEFDEQAWIVSAAARARSGQIEKAEREAVYAKLLADGLRMSRRTMAALRDSPIAKSHRGDWASPSEMAVLSGAEAKLLSRAICAPAKELIARPELLERLKIRDRLNGDDILAYARSIDQWPETAHRFEALLNNNQRILTSTTVDKLKGIAFVVARSGKLARPSDLHVDTPTNRQCLQDDDRIVGGSSKSLYRRLGVREHPTFETLRGVLAACRERGEAPPHPQAFYPAFVSALGGDRAARASLANEPILWVDSDYHMPGGVLVGTHIPRLLDGSVPILRQGDAVARAYLELGARTQPGNEHWVRFFKNISERYGDGEPVRPSDRRRLLEAYRQRGDRGLPDDFDEDVRCLLDRQGSLFSLADLRSGRLVEDDYPALATALAAEASDVRIAALTDHSRAFFHTLGISLLTSLAGAGTPVFGNPIAPPLWFRTIHRDQLLALLRKPLFSKALLELAARQRHLGSAAIALELAGVRRVVEGIKGVEFFDEISREFQVREQTVRVRAETAIQDDVIGVVDPRTSLDLGQLAAQALSVIVGAKHVAEQRVYAMAFLPLFLCHTTEDMYVYLERQGIDVRGWSDSQDEQLDLELHDPVNVGEEIVRQMVEGLTQDVASSATGNAVQAAPEPPTTRRARPAPPAAPPFVLPHINEVVLSVILARGDSIGRGAPSGGSLSRSSSDWRPRTVAEMERDREVGRRGEELVYREELERVRAMGHANAEELVIWVSDTDPGADHDIRSIGEDGLVRWLEVKSTTGTDGRFEWSRSEFEKALREGDRYELWRVYQVASTNPVAKQFSNPAALISSSRLVLELGSVRASLESLE